MKSQPNRTNRLAQHFFTFQLGAGELNLEETQLTKGLHWAMLRILIPATAWWPYELSWSCQTMSSNLHGFHGRIAMDSSLDRCINSCYPRLVVPWNCERILKITIIIEQWEHYFRKRTFNNIQTKQVYVNYFETFRCCPRKTLGTFDAKVLLTSTHRLPMIRPPDHRRVEVRPLASRPWDSMLPCQEWALGKPWTNSYNLVWVYFETKDKKLRTSTGLYLRCTSTSRSSFAFTARHPNSSI